MVNWYVKSHIDSLPFDTLFYYLKKSYDTNFNSSNLPSKNDMSFFSRFISSAKNKVRDVFIGNDTYEYVLNNIMHALKNDDAKAQFVDILFKRDNISKDILLDIIERNMDSIIPIFNQKLIGGYSQHFVLQEILNVISAKYLSYENRRDQYKEMFLGLYEGIKDEKFCFRFLEISDSKEWMISFLERGKLKTEDINKCIRMAGDNDPSRRELIIEHLVEFMSDTSCPLETFSLIKKYGMENEELKRIVDSRFDDIIDEMCDGHKELFDMMIREVYDKEGIRPSDITILGEGVYSKAFSVGSKVIKIGGEAETYRIPKNSARFLQPLVRYEAFGLGRIEISEKVEMDPNITDEELYEIYKELRDEGMIWGDAKWDNVGRLLKDNSIHLENFVHANADDIEKRQVDIEPYGPNLGFKSDESPSRVLKAGELVIIDVDFIYDENEGSISTPGRNSEEFEKRYQKELGEKNRYYTIEDCLAVSKDVTQSEEREFMEVIIDMKKNREMMSGIER